MKILRALLAAIWFIVSLPVNLAIMALLLVVVPIKGIFDGIYNPCAGMTATFRDIAESLFGGYKDFVEKGF